MMKAISKTVFASLILVFNGYFAFGQESMVTDVCVSMSDGLRCGISVVIPNASKEELLKSWESAVKSQSQYTLKAQKVGGELQLRSAELKGINSRVNIYTISYQRGEEAELITFYELPDGFIEPEIQEKEYLTIKKFVQEFAASVHEKTMGNNLKDVKKEVKGLERDVKKLQRKKDRTIKKIEKKKREIAAMQNTDIPEIEAEKAAKQKQIEDRKAQKRELQHKDMKAQAQKLVDEREKEVRKLDKHQEKLEKKIVKAEEVVREMERELEGYNQEIEQLKEGLDFRENKVGELKRKLD